jgi:hypothetical protein
MLTYADAEMERMQAHAVRRRRGCSFLLASDSVYGVKVRVC